MGEHQKRDALSKARDERCAPIARKALALCFENKVGLEITPEAKDIKDISEKILAEMALCDATVRDIGWTKVLMIQGIANAMLATYDAEAFESGNERYHGAAFSILEVITSENIELGMLSGEEVKEAYKVVGPKIVAKLKELGLNAVEVEHVFELLTAMANNVGENVRANVEFAKEKAAEKLFGVDNLDNVRISDIVRIQKQ